MYSPFTTDVLRDEAYRLEQAGPWGELYRVRAWAADGRLYWQSQPRKSPSVNDGMLRDFLTLADASDARIAQYAARWGVLHICRHGMPASHNPGPLGAYSGPVYWCQPLGIDDELPDNADGYDPLDVWRRLSAEAGALARIAAALRDHRQGAAADWATVYAHSGRVAPWWKQGQDVDHSVLADVVSEWVAIGGVRPLVRMRRLGRRVDGLRVEYTGRGLFGALAMQLALVVSAARGLYSCAGCPKWFTLPPGERKPQAGRGAYCPACRKAKVPQKLANERRTQPARG